MRKIVFNIIVVVSFLTILGAIYYLGTYVVQSPPDSFVPIGNSPLPFIVP
jgi:hypothetical protein